MKKYSPQGTVLRICSSNNARDMGLIPGLEDSTCHGATKSMPQLVKPVHSRACVLQEEKSHSEKPCTATREQPPSLASREKAYTQQWRPRAAKTLKINKFKVKQEACHWLKSEAQEELPVMSVAGTEIWRMCQSQPKQGRRCTEGISGRRTTGTKGRQKGARTPGKWRKASEAGCGDGLNVVWDKLETLMVCVQFGREFPDMRQNEKRIKFLEQETARKAGQPWGELVLNRGP